MVSGTSLLFDVVFCILLTVFVRLDQAWLKARFAARGETNFRTVRAFPFVVLGALLGILVLPIYYYASRGSRRGLAVGLALVTVIAILSSVLGA